MRTSDAAAAGGCEASEISSARDHGAIAAAGSWTPDSGIEKRIRSSGRLRIPHVDEREDEVVPVGDTCGWGGRVARGGAKSEPLGCCWGASSCPLNLSSLLTSFPHVSCLLFFLGYPKQLSINAEIRWDRSTFSSQVDVRAGRIFPRV